MSHKRAINSLILSRMSFGMAVWAFPRPVAAGGVALTEGDARRQWLLAGLVSDCADVVASVSGGVGGYLPKRTTAVLTAAALAPLVLGAIVLRR